jgi:hypothetical protein
MGMFAAGRGALNRRADREGILCDEDVGILLVAVLEERNIGVGQFGDELAKSRPAGLRIECACGKDAGEVEDGIERGEWASCQVGGPRRTSSAVYDGVAARRGPTGGCADVPKNDFYSGSV